MRFQASDGKVVEAPADRQHVFRALGWKVLQEAGADGGTDDGQDEPKKATRARSTAK